MKATASQIRQDLNHFGGFGQQGYGYNVKSLYNEIGKILGVEQSHNLIGIGAGNLGRALVRYQGFPDHGFTFKALFDVDEQLCGKSVNGIKIRHIDDVGLYPVDNTLDIIALCVPREIAKHVASSLYEKGFRNFWNFAQTELALPADANVKNVHLLDSLLEFSYTISTKEDKNE